MSLLIAILYTITFYIYRLPAMVRFHQSAITTSAMRQGTRFYQANSIFIRVIAYTNSWKGIEISETEFISD